MQEADLAQILAELRELGTDHSRVEAKRARGGLPTRLWETISAFSNSGGGVLLLGVDEASGFAVTGVKDPATAERLVAELCSTQLNPPVRPEIQTFRVDGLSVVVTEIPALRRELRPSFYIGEGAYRGSYVRVADGDRRLTEYEVSLLIADRTQPHADERPVPEASLSDLDADLVDGYLRRLRRDKPRIAGLGRDDEGVLRLTKVLVSTPNGDRSVPSVAGLLALGSYPQSQLPQANLTFVSYPTPDRGVPGPGGERFIDNIDIDGPIPVMADEGLRRLRQRMARRSVISGLARKDVYEYPEEAIREALVNALAHRDLGAAALGTQVQVEMFPDRLEVRNPGGLYGPVGVEHLATAATSSARNGALYKILEYVTLPDGSGTVCENRGSGVKAMIASLRSAGMSLPQFRDEIASFLVVFPNATLLDEQTVQWLGELGQAGLTDSQILALARMRRGEQLKNASYREETGVDSRVATAELRDLVDRQVVVVDGTRGAATYSLAAEEHPRGAQGSIFDQDIEAEGEDVPAVAADVWRLVRSAPRSRQELGTLLGLEHYQVLYRLRLLREANLVETDGPARAPSTRWRSRQ